MGPEIPFQDDENDLTLEELALLPLCGIPAYRAVRTFIYAFSSLGEGGGSMASPISTFHDRNRTTNKSKMTTTEHPQGRRRRVLVLRGHDGVGAMAVQLLAKRGWEVSVHVPFSASSTTYDPTTTGTEHVDPFPMNIQERARDWGADEIIFDEEAGDGIDDGRIAAIRVMESLREDGDVFDAILDTVGGKEVREAGERLLRSAGVATATSSVYGNEPPMSPRGRDKAKSGVGQFTTLVGDVPERPIPTTADHFRAGLRSFGVESGVRNGDEGTTTDMRGNKVEYAWVSVAQDVDWEGEDISETLSSVLRLALEERVRPVIGARYRIVPFEQAPYVFVDKGPLGHGCNVVVKIAG
jgi:NADPH:quinone reductase-like Zn-dependent oxidoreductase